MNPTLPCLAIGLLLSLPLPAAPLPQPLFLAADRNNPYNSPIQRANPNSRQGSVPATPPVRGPSTQPNPRPPTLDNRGIGNGENLRREQQPPNLEPTRPPRDSQRAP
ncbi:hypothetical protein NJF44_02595 [Pseudomonas guariconensis]|uniref:hypothetical protein n=1 Tax=Pseudomonas TaxID=286 RepID=UPI002096BB3A|nr:MULTISPECIES: hypothetical protein [Pseudomonas]MCO7638676.1 hypothetical protein [Pseudomonas sp. S 311-6]MCO7516920.1 hypothetical protein [Pseudomonas putida]MCO7564397.1 hypothetical protein [Pseudomonas mosselii]MCO7604128.1 hypothetical protein [Pseudomonas guariconensis]MCO7615799.1 hypothetical protein [Pseudomonas guariconensis]